MGAAAEVAVFMVYHGDNLTDHNHIYKYVI